MIVLQLIYQHLPVQNKMLPDKISYSYDHTTSYPTDSVVFQGSKSRIGINFSADYLKAPSTMLNGSSSSVISGVTTPFSLQK